MGALDRLAQATKARRDVTLILDVALEAEWQALRDKLSEAADADVMAAINAEGQVEGPSMANAMPATTALVDRMEALREKVAASQVIFTFESLSWADRITMQAAHPPRPGNRLDDLQGANLDTFMPAIIKATCIGVREQEDAEPEPVPDETWDTLLPTLAFAQMQRLYDGAAQVNDGLAQVPSSARFLLETQDSEASSPQPGPGTPASSDSTGGSPRGSRKSNATKKAASSA
jgi:hypothetical protein